MTGVSKTTAKNISEKRSKAMRESWRRRKAAETNGKVMPVGDVIKAIRLAKELVEICGNDREVAKALISQQ